MATFGKTGFRASGSNCFVGYRSVTGFGNYFGIGIAASTSKGFDAFRFTACVSRDLLGILMYTCSLYPSAVNVFISTAATVFGFAQLNGFNGNLIVTNIRAGLQCLIGYSLRTGIQLNNCAVCSNNVRTGRSYVYIALRCVNRTCDIYISIVIRMMNGTGSSGSIRKGLYLYRAVNIVLPFVSIVNVDFVIFTQDTFCACFNAELCTGKQCNVLCNGNFRAILHAYGNIAVDRKLVFGGIDRLGTEQAQFHRNGQALHGDLAVYGNHQTVRSFIIILRDGAGLNLEHTVRSDKRYRRALHTDKRNGNGHIAVFNRAGFQSHGNFDILDIVLRHREYAVRIINHAGNSSTAAPVLHLEVLIHGTAALYGNGAGARDIAPSIEVCTAVYRDVASAFHLDKANGTGNNTGTLTLTGILRTGNADRTFNGDLRTGSHRQRAVCARSNVICFTVTLFNTSGRCRTQRICRIVRNEQRYALGNGVLTCRKCSVVRQNNGFVCNSCNRLHCCIQSFVKGISVYDEPRGRFCKYGLNRHIARRLKSKACRVRNNGVIRHIDPTDKGHPACGSSNNSRAFLGNGNNAVSTNCIAAHGNATESAVKIKRNVGFRLRCNDRNVTHNQRIGGTVFCSGDRNSNGVTGIQYLAEAAGSSGILRSVDLQLVNGACSPIKGNLCRRTGFIIDGNGCCLSRGTNAKNTAGTLCRNGDGTVRHTVITGTGNVHRYTGNGLVCATCRKQLNAALGKHDCIQLACQITKGFCSLVLLKEIDFRVGQIICRYDNVIDLQPRFFLRVEIHVGYRCLDFVFAHNELTEIFVKNLRNIRFDLF